MSLSARLQQSQRQFTRFPQKVKRKFFSAGKFLKHLLLPARLLTLKS
jgi:hypothetical protein